MAALRAACRRRRIAAAAIACAALATLAGCGFHPLYGRGGGAPERTLAAIDIKRIPDRAGQMLHNMLLDRLTPEGQPARPEYTLEVSLHESRADIAVRSDESATRSNLTLTATFTLTRAPGPEAGVHRGFATSINSFNRLTSDYATLAAAQDARERGLREIAEEIRLRIAAALQTPGAFKVPLLPETDKTTK